MKVKHVIALFVFSIALLLGGSLFKIMSWHGGGLVLTCAYALMTISLILGAIKLLMLRDKDSILNK